LLLDEPLSNLDTKLRLEMRLEIRRVCKEFGLTAVYVTHDQKEALSIADRMAILESGQVRQAGRPAEIYRHPQSKFVADFMGETNFIDGQVASSGDATVLVETALGPFTASLDTDRWRPHSGERCVLSVRPESWTIKTAADSPNAVPGRIAERVYLGEMAQYQFAAGAQKLKIFELNPRFVDVSDQRDLFATVAPEDVIALPA
jgi:iron(III) transport system ATP-binding protein